MAMKFSKQSFSDLGLPDILLNVHCYTHSCQCTVCVQYANLCMEIAAERWWPEYLNYSYVMLSIINGNKNFPDFGKILSDKEHVIYQYIKK